MPASGWGKVASGADAASEEQAFVAENRIAGVRAAIIAFNSLAYHFLLPHEGTLPVVAYAIIALANLYGFGVLLLRPYRRFPAMLSSYFTSVLDAAFISVWLFATGGVHSPFAPLWYVSVTAVAFRYGPGETVFAAVLYAASYATLAGLLGQVPGNETALLIRCGYIGFVAAVGALLARENQRQRRERMAVERMAVALQESEDRTRRLADAAFEGIALQDGGRVLECNKAFAAIFGRAPEDCVGRGALDFLAPESHGAFLKDEAHEAVGLRADGSKFPIEVVARDIPHKGRAARVIAVRDVTDRKRAESAAAEQQRLREMDRIKTQFINNAAHELATPLTPIKLQAHLLKLGSLGPMNEQQQKAVSVVARNVDQLGLLVRDVLDSARIQGGHIRLAKGSVDLSRILSESVESFQEAARRQGVALDVQAPPSVPLEADAGRLTQVLFNLISNALKFTPAGGRIEVHAVQDAEGVHVAIHDSGAGIQADDIPKLFQPFSQVHDRMEASRSGTGLGLYISKGIVEQHGGRIWCESGGPGRGTTFSFTLPT